MATIERLTRHEFSEADKVFIDTCVLILLFNPLFDSGERPDSRAEDYSRAIRRLCLARSKVFVSYLVLSEYVNVYLSRAKRLVEVSEHILLTNQKAFRFKAAEHFREAAKEVTIYLGEILNLCSVVSAPPRRSWIENPLLLFKEGKMDFNDQLITQLCMENHYTLITDDSDFRNAELHILTENKRMLG